MALGATPAPQMEQLDPSIDEGSGGAPPKPTNSLTLGRGTAERLTQRGHPKLGALPAPRPMATECRPRKAILR
jgi:hypothetical protein